jgi:hypothetical protein
MEPFNTVTTAWTLTKTAAEISKKLFEIGNSIKDRKIQEQIDGIVGEMRGLKQSASELEDENRELREKLRFKSDDYEFRTPFWYSKTHPNQPLCAKCFAKEIPAPMGERGLGCNPAFRRCLVCDDFVQVDRKVDVDVVTE